MSKWLGAMVGETFREARDDRAAEIKRLRKGSADDKCLAEQLRACRKEKPCWLEECPVCEFRKERARQRMNHSRQSYSIGGHACATIAISKIKVAGQRRPLDKAKLKLIQETMKQVGLQAPITIRKTKKVFDLVDGRHRLKAAKRLGWDRILCHEILGDKVDAEIYQIISNLARAELRVLDEAELTDKVRRLLREKWTEEGQDAPPGGWQPTDAGINKAARRLGLSKEHIRRCKKIAGLSDRAKADARSQGIDNDQHALLLSAEGTTPAEQARIIADVVAARRAAKLQNASAAKQRAAKRRANLEGDIVKQEKALANLTAKLDRERQQLEQLDDEPGTVVGVSLSTSLRSPPIAASFPAGVPVTIAVKPAGRGFERLIPNP